MPRPKKDVEKDLLGHAVDTQAHKIVQILKKVPEPGTSVKALHRDVSERFPDITYNLVRRMLDYWKQRGLVKHDDDMHLYRISPEILSGEKNAEEIASKCETPEKRYYDTKSAKRKKENKGKRKFWSDAIRSNEIATEAAKKTITLSTYERNSKNRRTCLAFHGTNCHVCGFSFDNHYGKDIAGGFIHVHHLVPLSVISKQYEAKGIKYKPNPETDLIPVCPNCHAMFHYGFPKPKTFKEAQKHVEELKKRIKGNRK